MNYNQRGSNEVLLYANTNDATWSSDGDYSFSLLRPIHNVKNIQLMQYNLNWSFPNVRTSTNTLIFSESDSPSTMRTVTLPVGQYQDEDIAVDLGVAMTTAGTQTYTISINYVTERFTITGSSKNFTIYLAGTTIFPLLGMQPEVASVTSTGEALTFQNPMDLLPTTEIQIRMPNLIKNYETSATNVQQDLLQVASLSGYNYGDEIRENNASIVSETVINQISQFVISLTDQTSYSPDFNPLIPMSFLFKVELWTDS